MKRLTFTAGITICVAALAAGAVFAKPGSGHPPVAFEKVDLNADGQIDRSEMDQLRKDRLMSADENGDGALSLEELQGAAGARAAARMEKFMTRADENGDGVLSGDELTLKNRAARRFDRLDANGDKAISKSEFDDARERMAKRRAKAE